MMRRGSKNRDFLIFPKFVWDHFCIILESQGDQKQWFRRDFRSQNLWKIENSKISWENDELWKNERRKQCTFVFNSLFTSYMVRSTLLLIFFEIKNVFGITMGKYRFFIFSQLCVTYVSNLEFLQNLMTKSKF